LDMSFYLSESQLVYFYNEIDISTSQVVKMKPVTLAKCLVYNRLQ
jgi:hypothetical protein